MDSKIIPPIPKDLLEWLESRYPDKAPNVGHLADPTAIAVRVGEVSVIRFLRHIFELQNQNILEN